MNRGSIRQFQTGPKLSWLCIYPVKYPRTHTYMHTCMHAYIQYHTPYTIHHTPYTVYHIPYTIYHIPYTMPCIHTYIHTYSMKSLQPPVLELKSTIFRPLKSSLFQELERQYEEMMQLQRELPLMRSRLEAMARGSRG